MLSPMPEETLEGETSERGTIGGDSVVGDAVLTDVSDTELEGVVVDGLVGHEGAPTPSHGHVTQRAPAGSFHQAAGINGMSQDSVVIAPGAPIDNSTEVAYLKPADQNRAKPKMGTEEADLMKALERQLSASVEPDTPITYKMFKKALKIKDSYFGEHFFRVFDTDKSQTIEVSELLTALRRLTEGSATDKLKILFDIYDEDGNGSIDIEELRSALHACTVESSVTLGDEELDQLTQALFDEADKDYSGTISFDELEAVIEKHPGVKENLCLGTEQWLKPQMKKKKNKTRHRYLTKAYYINNLRKIIFFILFLLINAVLFCVSAFLYRDSNIFVILARGCGQCLNFNPAFIVLLMLRKCITWLRATSLNAWLPLDQNIYFHKLVGFAILVFTVGHGAMHLGNAVMVAERDFNLTVPQFLFTTEAELGWVAGLAPLTGWALAIILVVMVICSLPFIRRSGNFEVFYWTHMLYVPFWILLVLHARYFWCWFLLPGTMFLLEKFFRSKCIKRMRYGDSYIQEVNLLPSEVTHLVISRPPNMSFCPGDYLFIQVPAIARNEWHPFTISSAPEMEDKLWLHIRSAGHWTKKLYEYFDSYTPAINKRIPVAKPHVNKAFSAFPSDSPSKSTVVRMTSFHSLNLITDFAKSRRSNKSFKSRRSTYRRKPETHKIVNVPCFIDGPYGTPSREIFESEHAVLIGSGIGVTPFASILQSIIYRFKAVKRNCPSCSHAWYDDVPSHVMRLKKVDFIWINRDQKCFEWFVSLLTQLELEQSMEGGLGNLLEMHMFMTSALNKTDMKGLGLQMALDLIHTQQNKDLLTGLQTRTQPGRPNFKKLFTKIAGEKKGAVKVFFCGNPMLAKTIKQQCEVFGFAFSKENF